MRAQVEETYGPPSRVKIDGPKMILTYAWSTEGFIADLDALGPITHEETTASGGKLMTEYELCGPARHYRNDVEYRFEHPREKLIKPGCLATFVVRYRGEPGMTSISFSLEDYELARQHTAELDRQIVEALTGKTVEASDIDL